MAKKGKKTIRKVAKRCADYYLFEHIDMAEARNLNEATNNLHIVETVNWTIANNGKEKGKVHKNRYFAMTLLHAAALAVEIGIESLEVAETVVAIRRATEEEEEVFANIKI